MAYPGKLSRRPSYRDQGGHERVPLGKRFATNFCHILSYLARSTVILSPLMPPATAPPQHSRTRAWFVFVANCQLPTWRVGYYHNGSSHLTSVPRPLGVVKPQQSIFQSVGCGSPNLLACCKYTLPPFPPKEIRDQAKSALGIDPSPTKAH